jgi:hypothetical protein
VSESYDGEFPFTTPEGSEVSMFIQWKGTDLCVDFICADCGEITHYDGYHAYVLECPCGAVWQLGTQVIAKRVTESTPPNAGLHPPRKLERT